MELMLTGITIN